MLCLLLSLFLCVCLRLAGLDGEGTEEHQQAPWAQLTSAPVAALSGVMSPNGWDTDLGFSPYTGQVEISLWWWPGASALSCNYCETHFGVFDCGVLCLSDCFLCLSV